MGGFKSMNQNPHRKNYGHPQQQINMSKYKTAICRHYANNGHCEMADKCNFAHGDNELKEPQPGSSMQPPGGYQSHRGGRGGRGRGGQYNPGFSNRGGSQMNTFYSGGN